MDWQKDPMRHCLDGMAIPVVIRENMALVSFEL